MRGAKNPSQLKKICSKDSAMPTPAITATNKITVSLSRACPSNNCLTLSGSWMIASTLKSRTNALTSPNNAMTRRSALTRRSVLGLFLFSAMHVSPYILLDGQARQRSSRTRAHCKPSNAKARDEDHDVTKRNVPPGNSDGTFAIAAASALRLFSFEAKSCTCYH